MSKNKSAINQLEQLALNPESKLSDTLRLALTISVKLGLIEFETWIRAELNGYDNGDKIPRYREVAGQVKAFNPYRGWIPILSDNPDIMNIMSKRNIGMSIGEIEKLQTGNERNSELKMYFSPDVEAHIMNMMDHSFQPILFIPSTTTTAILEKVRNKILDWALELDKQGIIGEELSFTDKEKTEASNITYNIQQVGVMGNVNDQGTANVSQKLEVSDTKIDKILALVKNIEEVNSILPENIREDIESNNHHLKIEAQKEKPDNKTLIEKLSSLKNIAEGAAGNLTAQGIVSTISSLF